MLEQDGWVLDRVNAIITPSSIPSGKRSSPWRIRDGTCPPDSCVESISWRAGVL